MLLTQILVGPVPRHVQFAPQKLAGWPAHAPAVQVTVSTQTEVIPAPRHVQFTPQKAAGSGWPAHAPAGHVTVTPHRLLPPTPRHVQPTPQKPAGWLLHCPAAQMIGAAVVVVGA